MWPLSIYWLDAHAPMFIWTTGSIDPEEEVTAVAPLRLPAKSLALYAPLIFIGDVPDTNAPAVIRPEPL